MEVTKIYELIKDLLKECDSLQDTIRSDYITNMPFDNVTDIWALSRLSERLGSVLKIINCEAIIGILCIEVLENKSADNNLKNLSKEQFAEMREIVRSNLESLMYVANNWRLNDYRARFFIEFELKNAIDKIYESYCKNLELNRRD